MLSCKTGQVSIVIKAPQLSEKLAKLACQYHTPRCHNLIFCIMFPVLIKQCKSIDHNIPLHDSVVFTASAKQVKIRTYIE